MPGGSSVITAGGDTSALMRYLATHEEIDGRPRRGRPTATGVRCITPGCGRVINPPPAYADHDLRCGWCRLQEAKRAGLTR